MLHFLNGMSAPQRQQTRSSEIATCHLHCSKPVEVRLPLAWGQCDWGLFCCFWIDLHSKKQEINYINNHTDVLIPSILYATSILFFLHLYPSVIQPFIHTSFIYLPSTTMSCPSSLLTPTYLFCSSSRGVLKWPDGRLYSGTFKNGLEDG